MATRRGPRFKECRRLGVNTCGHPKALDRAKAPAFQKRGKISEYGKQQIEKQKVKAYYGILEKQLRNYYAIAKTKKGQRTGDYLLITLERRLDNLVYRIGFANSIRMARQIVNHGHVLVNGQKVDIPSYLIKEGDVISLREKSQKIDTFKQNFLGTARFNCPYIERDEEKLSGKLARLPLRAEIPVEINDQLVVEFYSR